MFGLRNGLVKLGLRDELLCRSLLPALLRRISEKSKWEEPVKVCQRFSRLKRGPVSPGALLCEAIGS